MKKHLLVCAFIFMLPRPVMASEAETFEALVRAKEWRAAGLMMFDRAGQLSTSDLVTSEMVEAGYYPEALARADSQSGGAKAYSLLLIARHADELSHPQRLELLARAEQDATGLKNLWVSSAISAAYLALGSEVDAQRVVTSIMAIPDVNAQEYRELAEAFERLPPGVNVGPWFTDQLSARLEFVKPGFNTAFAFQKVSLLYYRGGDTVKARSTLLKGLENVIYIRDRRGRQTANNALARTALEFGDIGLAKQYGEPRALIAAFALYAARTGNTQRALDILPSLGANLYVDHRDGTIRGIIREAIGRGDLVTAKTFIKLVSPTASRPPALYWLQIAEIARSKRRASEAEAATRIALEPYLQGPAVGPGSYHFPDLYLMAVMLMASGEVEKARVLSDHFDPMIDAIKPKMPMKYIEPRSLAASLCGKLRDFDCSAREIMAAYEALRQDMSHSVTASSPKSGYAMASDYIKVGSALGAIAISSASKPGANGERNIGR